VVGWRHFNDYNLFKEKLESVIKKEVIVVSGGASGVDSLAERWADEKGYKTIIYKADWKKYGRAAGPMRNTKIVEECDFVVAFPSSKSVGTYDTMRKAGDKLKYTFNI